MSRTHVPADLRRLVVERADQLCEYCLIHEVFIKPLTGIAQVTELIFKFNDLERIMKREALQAVLRYPPVRIPGKE